MLGSFFRKPKPQPHLELDLPEVEKGEQSEIAHLNPKPEAEAGIVVPPPKKPLLTAENIALIAVLLLMVVGALGIWSWSRYHRLSTLRQEESKQHEIVLDSLLQVKSGLESSLDQLESEFSALSVENDTLAQRLANATNILAEKEAVIEEVKKRSVREENALREQVQRLQRIKDRYEAIIDVLGRKNAALTEENQRLRGVTDSLGMEISDLGRKLEEQIRQTFSAQYKASGFRLEMIRCNDKPTIRARRTRELIVYFDLNRVPASYQGNQKLYLVITDDKGQPISSPNPIEANVTTEKGQTPILAQMSQSQNVIANQHVELRYKLEDRLKKGTYIVSVYSEKGPLGVASFRLT